MMLERIWRPRLGLRWFVMLLATTLVLAGCPEEEELDDDDQEEEEQQNTNQEENNDEPFDFAEHDSYELVPFQADVDRVGGHPDIESGVPEAGEVRVGRIASEDTGFEGVWSHCRSGDFLLSNSEIVVCIQEESTNRYELYDGGVIVDARRHDQPEGDDVLDMVFPLIDFGTTSATSVEVVRDGSDGVAVLRVTGQDIELAHMTGVLGYRIGTRFGITVETEYRLLPDSSAVEMVTRWTPSEGREYTMQVGDWFAYGDRARVWTPGEGHTLGDEMPWVGGHGEGHSFGLVFEDLASPMGIAENFSLPWAEMRIDNLEMSDVEPGVTRRWFVVGDGTIDSIRRLAAEVRGEELIDEPVQVSVVDEGGNPVAGAEVKVGQGEGWTTIGHSDDDGHLSLLLDEGSYTAKIRDFAGPLEVERQLQVGGGGDPVELVLPEVASLELTIEEAETAHPLAARITFSHPEQGQWFEYALHGGHTTQVPAGEVFMTVTRGMEYDLYHEAHQFEAGQNHQVAVELVRGVDTEGWRSGDFHQHMEPSIDSRLHLHARVKENVTQGVELVVPTDHEVITDLQPIIDRLGLSDEMSTFPGVEISPVYAHYNLYPVPYRPHLRGRGSIELAYLMEGDVVKRRMPEIIAKARSFETDPVVQMNHPRNNSGMMAHVNFDPELGPEAVTHDDFTIDIDAIEVINRYGDVCKVLADWSGLLNAGQRVTGLGNSDSHRANAEAGTPRNYMHLDALPGEITPDQARDVLRAGRVSVASQAFIDFGDGTVPGDERAVDGDGRAQFHVRVQTPDWAQAQTLLVIVNGSVVERIDRSAEPGARFDFDEHIDLEIDEDSWVVFWADGPEPSGPLPLTRQVIAFTNPVFLTTGDGPWQAPGPRPLDLDDVNAGYCG